MTQPIAFFRDRILPLDQATVTIATHALNYGTGCFEGIRAYFNQETENLLVFRMADHFRRFHDSCHIMRIELPYSVEELSAIALEVLAHNRFRTDVYIRPLAFKAEPLIKVNLDVKDAFGLFAVPLGDYLPTDGIRVAVSSWRRIEDNAAPTRAKITGSYVNTALAVSDAHAAGFDDCIFLNEDGHVSEGSAANLFMVRKNRLVTPPVSDNLLEGITREVVVELARDLDLELVERHIDRSELYVADEVFLAGTGVQIVPVINIDHRKVGSGAMGPVTSALQSLYFRTVRGEIAKYRSWLTPVEELREERSDV